MRGLIEFPKPAEVDVFASVLLVFSGIGAFVYTLFGAGGGVA